MPIAGLTVRSPWAAGARSGACVCLHDARIHGKSLAFDETHLHRSDDNALENVAQNIALTEPVQSVLGEGRVVGNRVIEIEPAEPPVCEVEPYLLAQLPLRADAEAIANDKHPDQQFGIDRRPADVAVEWTQLLVQVAEYRGHEDIDPA